MQLIWVQFLPLSQVSCSQGRIQDQDATPKDGTEEILRRLHSTTVLIQVPYSHKAHCFPFQVAEKGLGGHQLTGLLGHCGVKTENQWGQEKEVRKTKPDFSTQGGRGHQALFSAHGKFTFFLKIYMEISRLPVKALQLTKSASCVVTLFCLCSSLHHSSASAGGWRTTATPKETGHTFNLSRWVSPGTCSLGET